MPISRTQADLTASFNPFIAGSVMGTLTESERLQNASLQEQTRGLRARREQQQQLFDLLLGPTGDAANAGASILGQIAGGGFNIGGNFGGGGFNATIGGPGGVNQPGFPDSGRVGESGGFNFGGIAGFQQTAGAELAGLVDQFGESQRARINQDFDASRNSVAARLEAGGFGSSSLLGSEISGVDEARQQSLLGLEDALLAQRIGVRQDTADDISATLQQQQGIGADLIAQLLGGIL